MFNEKEEGALRASIQGEGKRKRAGGGGCYPRFRRRMTEEKGGAEGEIHSSRSRKEERKGKCMPGEKEKKEGSRYLSLCDREGLKKGPNILSSSLEGKGKD